MESNPAKDPVSLILVGRTGSGKSSTGNTILQKKVFDDSSDFGSSTRDCCLKEGTVLGEKIKVLDTPGLFDTDQTHEEIGVLLIKTVINMHPGFQGVLYVIRYGVRYTEEEYAAYTRFRQLFGSDVTGHMIVVLTGGDALQVGDDMAQKLSKAPRRLRAVLDDCNWRYVVLNNMAANGEKQVAGLLQQVKELQDLNRNRPYVCSGYSQLGKTIEEQVGQRLREIEELEVKTKASVQRLERELTHRLEEMSLTRKQHEEEMADISRRLDEERKRMVEEWERKLRTEREDQERKRHELEIRLLREKRHRGMEEAAFGLAGTTLKIASELIIAFVKK